MQKDGKEKNLKIQVQKALNEEADKTVNEISVERIEILVKILNTYDKAASDISDYERFLEAFNLRNGVMLRSSKEKKGEECNIN